MSAAAAAHVMIGIKLSDLVSVEDYIELVRKYNEDTGNPYDKHVRKERLWVGNVNLDKDAWVSTHGPCSPEEWVEKVIIGLCARSTGGYGYYYNTHTGERDTGWKRYNYDEWVAGIEIGYVSASKRIDQINPQIIGRAIENATNALRKFGYSGPINMYLVRYFSS